MNPEISGEASSEHGIEIAGGPVQFARFLPRDNERVTTSDVHSLTLGGMDAPNEHDLAKEQVTPHSGRFRLGVMTLQSAVVGFAVDVLVLLVLAVLVWVVIGVAGDVWTAVTARSAQAFKTLSVELLTVFIFIELFHSLTEYVRFRRIRVTNLVDASLAFVLREVWMVLYAQGAGWQEVLSLAALILALGAVRTLAVVYSPSERAADHAEV